jgi:hypothetical protein
MSNYFGFLDAPMDLIKKYVFMIIIGLTQVIIRGKGGGLEGHIAATLQSFKS